MVPLNPWDDCNDQGIFSHYKKIRSYSEDLAHPLNPEDFVVQSMPDVSPPKWHLAHVTWFFEKFILEKFNPEYKIFDPSFHELFNSYYLSVGQPFSRPDRGLLSKPYVAEVFEYRRWVDNAILALEGALDEESRGRLAYLMEIGLHHEQQHQELLLMDILYNFFQNPLFPTYSNQWRPEKIGEPSMDPFVIVEGVHEIGANPTEFSYDNERPRHKVYLHGCRLQNSLVTNGEFAEFIAAGGYQRPEFWLSDGWSTVQGQGWNAPLYWVKKGQDWFEFTLQGLRPLELTAPVRHVSYYEASAFAEYAEGRLPTEAEWEVACAEVGRNGSFFGEVWQWTASAYSPYPGFKALDGALGEYNGKFMCSQYVLRGSSSLTSPGHERPSYRNFFYPWSRWQRSGIRLAKEY